MSGASGFLDLPNAAPGKASGSAKISISAQIVSSRPKVRNRKKIGTATIAGAIMRVDRI